MRKFFIFSKSVNVFSEQREYIVSNSSVLFCFFPDDPQGGSDYSNTNALTSTFLFEHILKGHVLSMNIIYVL